MFPTAEDEAPSPEEIRRRLDLYLALPGLPVEDEEYALRWRSARPEVDRAVGPTPWERPPVSAETILGVARLVLELHRETTTLAAGLPPMAADLRDLAELLASDVRRLLVA